MNNSARVFGAIVYVAAVTLATVHNVNLYSQAAVGEVGEFFAVLGAMFVGLNALALPYALHNWAVSGSHRTAAIVLYALDVIALALNAIVDNALVTGIALPALLDDYLIYAPATFILPLATWGILFVLDPGERAAIIERQVEQEFNLSVARAKADWLKTAEGRARAQMQAARTLALGSVVDVEAYAQLVPAAREAAGESPLADTPARQSESKKEG